MIAYCNNNPIMHTDPSGRILGTIWDIISLGESIYQVCKTPNDPWAWVCLGGDALDLLPVVSGCGEATKVVKTSIRIADDVTDTAKTLSRASEFGIKTYKNLRKALKGTNLEAHHIIEQRFLKSLGKNADDTLCVAVTKGEHQEFTNLWRKYIPYRSDYSNLSKDYLWEVAQNVYAGYPELIQAAWDTIYG